MKSRVRQSPDDAAAPAGPPPALTTSSLAGPPAFPGNPAFGAIQSGGLMGSGETGLGGLPGLGGLADLGGISSRGGLPGPQAVAPQQTAPSLLAHALAPPQLPARPRVRARAPEGIDFADDDDDSSDDDSSDESREKRKAQRKKRKDLKTEKKRKQIERAERAEEAKRQRLDDQQTRKAQLSAAKALTQQRSLCTRTVLKLAPVQAAIAALTVDPAYKKVPAEYRTRVSKVWSDIDKLKQDAEASQIAPVPTFNVGIDAISAAVLAATTVVSQVKAMLPQLRRIL